MLTTRDTMNTSNGQTQRAGEFFNRLSPAALRDLESMEFPTLYQPGMMLFSEKATPQGIFIVVSGEVKLSINSSEGKRLILSIAKAGEVLGLSSALSGLPSEMTAEIMHPSRIAIIERDQFIAFMGRHPEVYQVVTQELSLQYKVACEQLRTVALSGSAPEKLARLLLDWSENGQKTEVGTRFRFSLTHEEIGEFIGASRETVTRTLSTFKSRRLVAFHGSILEIPSRVALEHLAGV
ncbi:MAG TPA: Crp/Fnr family transcriptional regulator [Terracidiphilus sp.]|jgi:CRP/FNR family cyclic AMP-dependent transcriptional regulator|nr:Crp/Fnr family transcriptional regulator [Terracidiphilus sp.]